MQEAINDVNSKIAKIKKLCEESPVFNRGGMVDLTELSFKADPTSDLMSIVFAREASPVSYLYFDGIKSMYTIEKIIMKDVVISKFHRVAEQSEIPEQLKTQFFDWLHHKKEMKLRIKGKEWKAKEESGSIISIKDEYRKPMKKLYQLLVELYKILESSHIRLLPGKPMVFDEKLLAYKNMENLEEQLKTFINNSDNIN